MNRRDLLFASIVCWAVGLVFTYCFFAYSQDLPPEPDATTDKDNWVYPTVGIDEIVNLDQIEDGEVVCQQWSPEDGFKIMPGGILMSEAKAHYFGQVIISYKEIRKLYQIDLEVNKAVTNVYETELETLQKIAEQKVKESKRSWWEKNDFVIGLTLGIVLTIGITIGIAAGLYSIGR